MPTVKTHRTYDSSIATVESHWHDTANWPNWVDGLARVTKVQGDWPKVGANVSWQSSPAGRGTVNEKVVEYDPGHGHAVDLIDDSMVGRQTVVFTPVDQGVDVSLSLEYSITKKGFLTPVVDFLFVRRAMRMMLESTLSEFGGQLEGAGDEPA